MDGNRGGGSGPWSVAGSLGHKAHLVEGIADFLELLTKEHGLDEGRMYDGVVVRLDEAVRVLREVQKEVEGR